MMTRRYTRIITDLDIQALVDGELSRDEEMEVMSAISRSPEKFQRFSELSAQRRSLQTWWTHLKREN